MAFDASDESERSNQKMTKWDDAMEEAKVVLIKLLNLDVVANFDADRLGRKEGRIQKLDNDFLCPSNAYAARLSNRYGG